MSAIIYQPFSEFLTIVQQLVAPEDLGEEMINSGFFRDQVAGALADIQTLIPWTRGFNTNIYTKADVEEFCATSVFQGPMGKITQLFAYQPGRDCRKIYYKRTTTAKVDCWIEQQRCVQCTFTPAPTNIYDTPFCNYAIGGETACDVPYLTGTEDDLRFRSLDDDDRIFAVGPDYKVYAAPRFPCGYYMLMQWQGIRRAWADADLVMVDQQIREAIVNRVEMRMALKEREYQAKREYEMEYAQALRTIRFRYHDEQDPELKRDCTSAVDQMLPAFSPLYTTTDFAPYGGGTGGGGGGGSTGSGVQQVYSGRDPLPPDDPTLPALSYPVGGGTVTQWDVGSQSWV